MTRRSRTGNRHRTRLRSAICPVATGRRQEETADPTARELDAMQHAIDGRRDDRRRQRHLGERFRDRNRPVERALGRVPSARRSVSQLARRRPRTTRSGRLDDTGASVASGGDRRRYQHRPASWQWWLVVTSPADSVPGSPAQRRQGSQHRRAPTATIGGERCPDDRPLAGADVARGRRRARTSTARRRAARTRADRVDTSGITDIRPHAVVTTVDFYCEKGSGRNGTDAVEVVDLG
jgi:hypothetical protein